MTFIQSALCDFKRKWTYESSVSRLFCGDTYCLLNSDISVNDFGGWGNKRVVWLRGFFFSVSSLEAEIHSVRAN